VSGIVSRSGTLTYEAVFKLSSGASGATAIGMRGSDFRHEFVDAPRPV